MKTLFLLLTLTFLSVAGHGDNFNRTDCAVGTGAGVYAPPVYGNVDMNVILTGAFGGSYLGVLDSIRVTPQIAVVAFTKTRQFVAVGLDVYGVPLSIQPEFLWEVTGGGTIVNGLFTAGKVAGGFIVTVSYSDIDTTATVRVRKSTTNSRIGISIGVGL